MKLPGNNKLPSSQAEIDALKQMGYNKKWKYSVEDFFKTPEKIGFQISPNGKFLSYLAPCKRRKNIFIQEIGKEETKRITSESERDIDGYIWASDNTLVYIKDSGGDENYSLYSVDKNGDKIKNLTPFEGVRIEIVDDLENNQDEMIIAMNKNNPMLFEPYRINIITGDLVRLATNDNPMEPISSWKTDHEGKLRIATKVVGGTNQTLLYRETEDDDFREVITTDFKEEAMPLFFDFDDDNTIYMSSNLGRDKSSIVRFDLSQGVEVENIFGHDEVDVSSLSYSKKRKVITAASYITDKKMFHFFDKEVEAIFKKLEGELQGYEISIADHDKNEEKFIVRTYSDKSLGSYYLYDNKKGSLIKITDVSPWLDENDMSEMKPIQFTARDGIKINGYLTLPKGKSNQNIPIVINPHGGPWHRDTWGYNQEVQLMASRGFGVLQINFRASTGYGRKFWEAGFKEWGKSMQDDITDGVNWLIEQGIANPNKIAIYGGSYGGYATLAGITFTPDLYCAAIDYVGVSNLFTFLNTIPPYWKPYLDMMYEMVGHPEEDKEQLKMTSPALNTDKIKTPLFVVQGANDPRVNIDEADQIVKTMRDKGIDVPYLVKYDEGHGFRKEENRFEFYNAMIGFLTKYLL